MTAAAPVDIDVALVMGSRSDWPTLSACPPLWDTLGVRYESRVVSAHRTPERMRDFALSAEERGLRCIIACAGGAAHLPGMIAAMTCVPVLGVPAKSAALNGIDSLLSIVQMPRGVPVGTLAIGEAGGVNAALFAAAIVGQTRPEVFAALKAWRAAQTENTPETPEDPA